MRGFAPPPKLTISQWSDANRILSPESSAEPGKWSTSRVEYMREVMDCVGDPAISKIVCMKASQVAWTEVLNNTCGYFIDQDPSTILLIQPTIELAGVWSKDRLSPMLRDTHCLRNKVRDPRSRDSGNTIKQKIFPGGRLAIIGANAPAQLASRPIRVVLADEIDRYPLSAGTEGDPLALAAKRQTTFWNKKTLVGSTATVKKISVIEREYEASDMRRYMVPCHACDHPQHLQWSQVRWDKDAKGNHMPETAHYVCEACGAVWDDIDRWDGIKRGKWEATKPFAGVAGFHIPGLLSPWLTMHDVVREFLNARHDPQLLQVWTNTVLGETWEEASEKIEASALSTRGEPYTQDAVPEGVRLVTAGVDVQGDRLEVQIDGWGVREESWKLRYEVINGDPAQSAVWDDLDKILLEQYRTEVAGRVLRVRAACIDTGGHHANQVFKFCNARVSRRVFPIKGLAGPRPVWPKFASKTKDNRNKLWLVGVDTAKDAIFGRLRMAKPGPGYIHFPVGDDFGAEYFKQLTSEKVVTRKREGRPYRVWVLPEGARNEALDTAAYSLAARASIAIRLLPVAAAGDKPQEAPAAEAPPLPPALAAVARAAGELSPQGDSQKPVKNGMTRTRRPARRISRSGYMSR